MPEILYEDNALLVCRKPVGVLSEASNGRGMPELLSARLREEGKKDFIAGVHRLDKNVGGLMVFSRRKDVTGKLIEQVAQRQMEKEYLAILRGCPKESEGVLEDLLFHDSRCNKTFVVKRQRKGVRDAKLSYRVLASVRQEETTLTLVRVCLHTGRTHQIRVQFASRGMPLLGDIRYGSRDRHCDAALWSCRLCFCHPVSRKTVDIACSPPDQYPWNLFDRKELSL